MRKSKTRFPGSTLPVELRGERILRPRQAAELCGCSVSHLYRLSKAGKLHAPRRISHRVSGWRLDDLSALTSRAEFPRAA